MIIGIENNCDQVTIPISSYPKDTIESSWNRIIMVGMKNEAQYKPISELSFS